MQQFFDIGDYEGDMQLRTDIDRQCGVLYRSWKYELHTHYLELLEQGVPRPQDHPAEGCGLADWQLMVSQCWESPTWKVTLGCYLQKSACLLNSLFNYVLASFVSLFVHA